MYYLLISVISLLISFLILFYEAKVGFGIDFEQDTSIPFPVLAFIPVIGIPILIVLSVVAKLNKIKEKRLEKELWIRKYMELEEEEIKNIIKHELK